ncbi:DUF7524 family protein [Halodesulfurarchaeum formicicum]|uniref:Uncharacterized protein n=1 Tax=Halodesulfurarchaeum formicicum TaxID=1873524 RepID=A0A1J1ACD0_9EURY|nr:hypothetical protein [Halodesulfurarchaeum formicicum]APE95798.1 hypothetical protein HSR6_1355 [Halodesulfurarchaeum formicicum]
MRELTVYLNRDGLNTVETDERTVRASQSMALLLENHGKPTHIHFHPDDDLAALGSITEHHVFVPKGEWRRVELQFMEAAAGTGRLEITAGYGQEKTTIDVEAVPAEATESTEPSSESTVQADHETDSEQSPDGTLPLGLDTERLENPIVLGAAGAFLLVVILLAVVNPLAAIASIVAAAIMAVGVGGYLAEWDPFESDET